MNKNIVAAAIVGVIVVAGGTFALRSSNSPDSTDTPTDLDSLQQTTEKKSSDNPLGIDLTTALVGPYRITVTSTATDSKSTNAVVEADVNGNLRTTITDDGTVSSFIVVDGETYIQNPEDQTWIKFPAGDVSSPINTEGLDTGFTKEDIEELNRLDIDNRGTGPCTAGTCRIYGTTDQVSGDTGIIKVDTASNRLSDIELTSAKGEVTTMSYDYSVELNITAPESFTEYQIPDIGDLELPE